MRNKDGPGTIQITPMVPLKIGNIRSVVRNEGIKTCVWY